MIVSIDKKLFEILQDMGVDCTYQQFRDAYSIRKEQREKRRNKATDMYKYESMLLDFMEKEDQKVINK